MKLNSKQLRKIDPLSVAEARDELPRQQLYLILEDIFDTYNIGGLFRLSDALGVAKVYLVGETTTPPHNRIHKASCGTYKVVPWQYCATAAEAIADIRQHQPTIEIIAVEQSNRSIPYIDIQPELPAAIIVGNETSGVTPSTLALCDHIVEIPMWGINISLNVIVSAAIVSYHYMTTSTPSHPASPQSS